MDIKTIDAKSAMRHFCIVASGALVVIVLLVSPQYSLQDPDSLWHTVVGLDMLRSASFPTIDSYSYTHTGQRWIAHEWLGEAFLAVSYLMAGWNGVVLSAVLAISLTISLFVHFISRELRPSIPVGLVFVIMFLMSPTYNARPYIYTFPIVVIWTFQLFRAAAESRQPPYWLLALLVLWVNLHGTFVLGFFIAFFAFLDYFFTNRFSDPKTVGKWVIFGLLCPFMMLINPYGIEPFYEVVAMASSNESIPFVNEWRPFNPREYVPHAAFLAALIFGLFASGYKTSIPKAGYIVFSLFLFLSYIRFVFFFLLTFPIVAAKDAAKAFPAISKQQWISSPADPVEIFIHGKYKILMWCGGLITAAAVGFFLLVRHVEPVPVNFAKPAIEYARENGLTEGNVLNSYNLGGTLIFHGIPTFIDGRTDQLYGDGFVIRDDDMGKPGGRSLIKSTIEKYNINWAMLTHVDPRLPYFDEMEDWEKVYEDEYTFIYKKELNSDERTN